MSSIAWFKELSNKDIAIAGGKGASLAEMYNIKLPIPSGFIVTAQSFKEYIQTTGIQERIMKHLTNLDVDNTQELQSTAKQIQELILSTSIAYSMSIGFS